MFNKKEYNAKYNLKNKEKILKQKAEYHAKNKEKFNKKSKDYYKNNKEKIKEYLDKTKETRDKKRLEKSLEKNSREKPTCKRYNITPEKYQYLILQKSCAICGKKENGRALDIDHNHETGKVRERLCLSCNTGLGKFKDNIYLLEAAIQYLKKHGDINEDTNTKKQIY